MMNIEFCSSHIGRTALHWAASVDNEVATMILTRNGTKVDAADNKVCFL